MSYRGAGFCGWQIQPEGRTVQGELERALSTLLRTPVQVVGAGRTDTGVNASHYVAHFDMDSQIPKSFAVNGLDGVLDTVQLRYKLNAFLPEGIAIREITPASPDFHARFDARLREYTYFLNRTKSPFSSGWSYYYAYPVLDFDAMNAAAQHLLGTHDFSCFEKSGGDNKTSICTIFQAGWHEMPAVPGPGMVNTAGQFCFRIAGDRFLRNMVRAIVGTLLEVGRGKRTPDEFRDLIGSGTRCDAGESVPGHALFLSRIEY